MTARDTMHALPRLRRLGDQTRLVLVAVMAPTLVTCNDLDALWRTGAIPRDSLFA
jgi:hypothetical protein